ncbi:FAD synthetase 2, chloroplastic [Selaginella moellendorffii]|uniref:FAD synthetase 2, chloroplastic n=1 Tax=Selaginella moellendorffii TaxID=88036 RepID=UPI000D1C8C20|nr:FAD synthetase 2, chloroplastic [Selaginella moellendorffii]|eukprot:XP_024538253.1 FAD synthetase 2, chloroplastic [Selaginella moellendorffii]
MLLWSAQCSGLTPDECSLEFGKVRHLSPQQFVEKLAVELRVKGVVAGENYRFGYKAAGDSSELKKLCKEWGLDVFVVEAVMDKFDQAPSSVQGDARDRGQVSSTRVRKALADGNMKRVTNLLGRNHRLFMTLDNATRIQIESEEQDHEEQREKRVLYKVPLSDSCNQYPAQGSYRCKVAFQGLGQQQQTWNGNGGALERSWECDVEITEDEARIWDLETPESLERRQGFVSIEFR